MNTPALRELIVRAHEHEAATGSLSLSMTSGICWMSKGGMTGSADAGSGAGTVFGAAGGGSNEGIGFVNQW